MVVGNPETGGGESGHQAGVKARNQLRIE